MLNESVIYKLKKCKFTVKLYKLLHYMSVIACRPIGIRHSEKTYVKEMTNMVDNKLKP